VNRERDGEDEGSRNETDRSRDTETGAEGGCQSFGDCSHQHSGASGFEESLSWQAKVTDTPCTEKFTICYKSVCRRNEGKMHERKRRVDGF